MFLNKRLMYGILLSTGGPNSVRDSASVFKPPMNTVPPSGTFTVVLTVIVVNEGCWKNIWKMVSGGPCVLPAPGPYRIVGTGTWIGIKGTFADTKFVIDGVMFMRTKRRSAEMTGVTC